MQLLREESLEPTDEVLASVLGDVYGIYTEFISSITAEPLNLIPEWKYYKDARAWLCKIVFKRKTVSWMSVWTGALTVTTYFPEKLSEEASKLAIDNKLIERFRESGLTRKNPYYSLDISSTVQLRDLLRIMEYKKATFKS